jgi:hypothetical protein
MPATLGRRILVVVGGGLAKIWYENVDEGKEEADDVQGRERRR